MLIYEEETREGDHVRCHAQRKQLNDLAPPVRLQDVLRHETAVNSYAVISAMNSVKRSGNLSTRVLVLLQLRELFLSYVTHLARSSGSIREEESDAMNVTAQWRAAFTFL